MDTPTQDRDQFDHELVDYVYKSKLHLLTYAIGTAVVALLVLIVMAVIVGSAD